MIPFHLTCESFDNPMGIDLPRPRLGWMIPASEKRSIRQSAYQILVASSAKLLSHDQGDLWDSGHVESDASLYIRYSGQRLSSRMQCFWKVRVWDESGALSEWSELATWEMGILEPGDWKSEWIAAPLAGGHRSAVPAPFFRKEFTVERKIASARLYVTARGLYEFSLNGNKVGDDLFTPGDTDYNQRIQYQVYDVTSLLHPGMNAAGAILGDGWYCGYMAWGNRQYYGERAALLAQIEVQYVDGTTMTMVSDSTWKTAFGPILEADFLQGEIYDARREMTGWNCAGYADAEWTEARLLADEGAKRGGIRGPMVRRQMELPPIAIPKQENGTAVFDLGQNMVGWVRLRLKAPTGTTVRLRFSEMLDSKGNVYVANLRTARVTDYYTCKGGDEETWEPRFTFHGFRYVEVSGFPGTATPGMVTGIVLHSEIAPTGQFECSDPLVNRLQKNIQWGQRGNFIDIPTDCPQRDERLGWLGDAQVFAQTAAFNFDIGSFYTKWQVDIADAQAPSGEFPMVAPDVLRDPEKVSDGGPAWAEAGVICPWTVYLCYGDSGILAEHYDSLCRFFESLVRSSRDNIRPQPGYWNGYGDWLALDGDRGHFGLTPKTLIGTAFFAYTARLLSQIAKVLGKTIDSAKYREHFENIRKAYQKRFITPEGLIASGTQTACVLTLYFDLAPEHLRPAILDALVQNIENNGNKLATGFVGTSYLPHVLSNGGRIDVAYRLLNQKQWPSWLYAVTQGATTIWERWDGWTDEKGFQSTEMNSFNHYAYGAIGSWLYNTVAGLNADPEEPGYKHAVIKPQPGGGITCAKASLMTRYGKLISDWELKDGTFRLHLMIPSNTHATVTIPIANGGTITEGGRPVSKAQGVEIVCQENGTATFNVGSGTYCFLTTL